ncbi:hypothetical protein PUNSTDRAFT_139295 [Punctularia strigosozonata HHB-11173 SS5]|uniref:Uncharacterized protein n=1 Tax=Punctularia strigosozonata (strain HHB-11173) TaxID=741275 RepID=R7S078_PUNST|nr:uncharacterized protein PUNSTDRAFT_139295 [Punctularia strigosozonata HHB-11173 SS5]EIN03770.1 hypothetical protein PUNSTDRAFT_139295 [Punctularia strigosozonata HHB-11173 SS5]
MSINTMYIAFYIALLLAVLQVSAAPAVIGVGVSDLRARTPEDTEALTPPDTADWFLAATGE